MTDLNSTDAPLDGGPFAGFDLGAFDEPARRAILEASQDFRDVLAGRKPSFARTDVDAPLPADGGSHGYVGRGYRLWVCRSLSSFGGVDGYVYGPVLSFDQDIAPGNERSLAATRFYTAAQLHALLAQA
ncbi:hypothetical protein GLA29479_282 [Lysobacter antibioticus]|uniref:hypothetical protein n=1 Tax=Lysobacter antibioticus TaxID=84531 RepID=UPI0007173F07|nr:hypothetical protein [Lysobacter antibioticus]ALN61168.1 hypothetical protein GLA29479_282 [Lysobacter antibioticus]